MKIVRLAGRPPIDREISKRIFGTVRAPSAAEIKPWTQIKRQMCDTISMQVWNQVGNRVRQAEYP